MKRTAFLIPVSFFLLFVLAFSGCTDPWEAVNQLESRVMEVHDSSMVKMDQIYQTQKGLKGLLTVEPIDTANFDKTKQESLMRAIDELDDADEAMFDWMAQYKAPKKEDYTVETATTYLNEQKASITAVDKQMDQAIENGETLVKKYSNE